MYYRAIPIDSLILSILFIYSQASNETYMCVYIEDEYLSGILSLINLKQCY